MPVDDFRTLSAPPVFRQGDPGNLRTAAPDVEQQGVLLLIAEERQAAVQRQPRLLIGSDDLQLQADIAAHPLHELLMVGGAAAGIGGNATAVRDSAPGDLFSADLERLQGPHHGRFRQLAAPRDTLAQAHDP